jgi:ABC-type transport system involved in multi-copper enzyme maturation permease subunit
VLTIAGYALRESIRRRVFRVVLMLTALFLALYGVGAGQAFEESTGGFGRPLVDVKTVVGATLLGLAMFATLFLGTVLAVFLTLGAVRGDEERGLLQPLVVRPVGRAALLGGRFVAAATVCGAYVAVVYALAVLLTGAIGGFWPDRFVLPGLGLVAAVAILSALSLLGSIGLSATANGILAFMVFGAGLVAGLLGQIGDALGSETLGTVALVASYALPFEALYQAGLSGLTADAGGATAFVVRLGPFGGAQEGGVLLWLWAALYLAAVGATGRHLFARRDL